ncbi:class I SAM-dependent methyltransferase [Bradyrhizobium sp. CCBAU 53340]|uniref:class I SAM-dependent methyltransferase n=1 Tax=Bradyrhizobium sp. CCBAU 53340 TaxID=1325112 RepID=UPI00188DAF19|nr:class I SAM-dependent methyltransferase [Bradyrhizobium sp. CCBAU 53340]QOZ43984.1 class I SAM-dependent methyltransferase [Bradyrhizobium sp. CCBAU 53340]
MTTVDFEYKYEHMNRGWPEAKSVARLRKIFDDNLHVYKRTLEAIAPLEEHFDKIALEGDAAELTPFWNNIWLPPLDAIALAGLVALHRPKTYLEVGSGNSTKFVRWIIDTLNLQTRIVSIDPFPRAEIDAICDVTIRSPLELADQSVFFNLAPNDIVFMDNSHRSFPSSDVTAFFMEILPNLPHDVIFGMHDIFLPFDYPLEWKDRFYNEQYLLAAYLYGGADQSKHIIGTQYMARLHRDVVQRSFPRLAQKGLSLGGGIFFMKRFVPSWTNKFSFLRRTGR